VDVGAVNFLTGAGGFLQTIIFGYGGLRLHPEQLTLSGKLPLPPASTYLYLHKVKYLGSALSFNYTQDNIALFVDSISDDNPLELVTQDQTYTLTSNGNTGHYYIFK
jgi:trehalose/maltose hydrolase-like predicted phosphorylase